MQILTRSTGAALVFVLALALAFGAFSRASSRAALPAPIDIPVGPDDPVAQAEAPGGVNLPEIGGAPAAGAPALAMITDVTFPDETLVATGLGLRGARLVLWSEGALRTIDPTRSAEDRLQALVPRDMPRSTLLVWPVGGEAHGAPIRVNGATAWWGWPARFTREETGRRPSLLVMGKNLALPGVEPRAYLAGPGASRWLKVTRQTLYQLEVELPGPLAPGRHRVWAHNGTGGRHGWSEPVAFDVSVDPPAQAREETIRIEPTRGDSDDTARIQAAIDRASQASGATIALGPGRYRISRPLILPSTTSLTRGLRFTGVGMGRYDPDSGDVTGEESTILVLTPGTAPPVCMLDIDCPGAAVCDLTLIGQHPGVRRAIHAPDAPAFNVVRVRRADVAIERVRMVLLDRRPEVPAAQREDLQIYDAALHLVAPGMADLRVDSCEFHSAGSGIEVGTLQRGHMESGAPDPSTDSVRITGCVFRGHSRGFYKEPTSPTAYSCMGIFNEGVQVPNGKRVIIQGCDFAGADRRGGRMLNRSICVYNTSARDLYIAENRSRNVGTVCPRTDRSVNQGEQILFHFRYPHGGYFDVIDAGACDLTVNPDDPRNQGRLPSPHHSWVRAASRVPDEVGANDHWVVLVSAGRGLGQYRVVTGTERAPGRVRLRLERPWRVRPDDTSRVTLGVVYRRNIVTANTIDAGFIDPRSKVAGVLFWHDAIDNVIAGCTLRHLGYGVGFNAGFRNPCAWNLVRDNTMEHMGGMSVECNEPTFYVDSCTADGGADGPLFRPGSDVASWYSIGNAFRSNRGADAPSAALVHARLRDASARALPEQQSAGVLMPVLENNRFAQVQRGVVINRATLWPVLRNNTVDGSASAVFDQSAASAAPRPSPGR